MAESAPILHNPAARPLDPQKLMSGYFANLRRGIVAALLFLSMATVAAAQSITDPVRIEFTPSAAPDQLDVRTGTPMVLKYTLDIYLAGSPTIVQTADLGNPLPDPDGMIRVGFVSLLTPPLTGGVVYEAVVDAVGSVQTVSSARSETFAFSGGCTAAISPTSSSLSSSAATNGSVAVTANSSCAWTSTSNASWITITANAYGTGNAAVSYSVAANTGTTSRSGTMTIGGQTFTVTQPGTTPCSYTISPTSSNLGSSAAATGTVAITTGASCGWTATSNAAWLTISNGASGSGNGSVTYNVAANTSTASRTGTMTIAGQTFSVTQAGVACTFTISPNNSSYGASAGTGTVAVTAGSGCSWSATSNAAWLTINSGASGSGNGSVTFSVAANTGTAARTGTLTIAGQSYTVTQAAPSCVSAISPLSSTLVASIGASGSVVVTASAGCNWTAVSNDAWITITVGAAGTGNGNVAYSVAANTTSAARTGTLTIGGSVFTITQPGASCAFSISPFSSNLTSPNAATGTVTVSTGAGCNWTATSNAAWITITSGASGTGGGSVNYSVASNTGTTSRTGTITVAGQTFTVTQASTACSFTISPTSQTFPTAGGTGSVTITTSSGCNWTASSNAAWVTITSSTTGTGSGTVTFNVIANPGTLSRAATLTIAGKSFSVTQSGPSCTYSLTPSLITAPPTGTSGSITVTTQSTCNWTATTISSWVTVSGSGTGSGTVTYTVQPNTGTIARSGLVNIGGVNVGVSQAAATAALTPSSLQLEATAQEPVMLALGSTDSQVRWSSGVDFAIADLREIHEQEDGRRRPSALRADPTPGCETSRSNDPAPA